MRIALYDFQRMCLAFVHIISTAQQHWTSAIYAIQCFIESNGGALFDSILYHLGWSVAVGRCMAPFILPTLYFARLTAFDFSRLKHMYLYMRMFWYTQYVRVYMLLPLLL